MPTLRDLWPRMLLIVSSLAAILGIGWVGAMWCFERVWHQGQVSYHAESERFNRDFQRRLRDEIARLEREDDREPEGNDAADRAFKLLRLSPVAGRSLEVDTWIDSPHSPERTSVALKWAVVAAGEAACMAELHSRWKQDHEAYRMPRHITDREVKPFPMPADWTPADLKYSTTKHAAKKREGVGRE